MLSRFVRFSLVFLLLVGITLSLPHSAMAQTQPWGGRCIEPAGGGESVATIQGLECLIGNVLSIALSGIGIAGFVMMIVGAFRYMLSGGNAKGTEGGRNTITFAIVGLVVALSSFIILNIVAAFTGINVITSFQIPNSDVRFDQPNP
jgi:hypothetical protein